MASNSSTEKLLDRMAEALEYQSVLLKELSETIKILRQALYNESTSKLPEEKLLPIRDAAARLGIGQSTLRRLIGEGKVKAKRVPGGKKWLIPEAEIKKYLS
jgi:excisionase family DNA binding protein